MRRKETASSQEDERNDYMKLNVHVKKRKPILLGVGEHPRRIELEASRGFPQTESCEQLSLKNTLHLGC